MRARFSSVVSFAFLLVACGSGGDGTLSGGDPNNPHRVDGGDVFADGGRTGFEECAALADAPRCVIGGRCPIGLACVGGACVPTCGTSASALSAALGDGVAVTNGFCTAGGVRAGNLACVAGHERLSIFSATLEGGSFNVRRLSDALGAHTETVFDPIPTRTTETVFMGGYVEPNPSGTKVAFGYTRQSDFGGEVLVLDVEGRAVTRVESMGNYDVAWVDDTRLLVNALSAGTPSGSQGLYAVDLGGAQPTFAKVVSDLGDASGAVNMLEGESALLVGAYGAAFPGDGNLVFRFDLGLLGGGTPVAAFANGNVPRASAPSDFEVLGDRLVALDWNTGEFVGRELTTSASAVDVGAPSAFAKVPVGDVAPLPGGRGLLFHAGGALLIKRK